MEHINREFIRYFRRYYSTLVKFRIYEILLSQTPLELKAFFRKLHPLANNLFLYFHSGDILVMAFEKRCTPLMLSDIYA